MKSYNLNNYNSKRIKDVKENLERLNVELVILGDGDYVIDQYPEKDSTMLADGKLFIVTNSKKVVMPNIKGWSLNEVKTFANLAGLKLEYTGYGYVSNQSIPKDEIINTDTLVIELK